MQNIINGFPEVSYIGDTQCVTYIVLFILKTVRSMDLFLPVFLPDPSLTSKLPALETESSYRACQTEFRVRE